MGVSFPDRAGSRSSRVRLGPDVASFVGACTAIVLIAVAVADRGLAAAAVTTAILVPAAVIDVHTRRLPDRIIGAAGAALLVALALSRLAGGEFPAGGLGAGALVMCGPLLALHLVSPDAMGFGDVKLAVVLGAAIGTVDWRLTVMALMIAAGAGSVVGLVGRSRTIAFGPFLVAGTVVALLIGVATDVPMGPVS